MNVMKAIEVDVEIVNIYNYQINIVYIEMYNLF